MSCNRPRLSLQMILEDGALLPNLGCRRCNLLFVGAEMPPEIHRVRDSLCSPFKDLAGPLRPAVLVLCFCEFLPVPIAQWISAQQAIIDLPYCLNIFL